MKTYKDLVVWQKAMDLETEIYRISDVAFQAIYESTREIERMLSSLINKIGPK